MENEKTYYQWDHDAAHINVGGAERIASVIAGGFLFTNGVRNLRQRPFTSIVSLAASGSLLFRGATGYCAVNKAIGRDTAHQGPKPLTIKETFTVNKPKDEVYAAWRKLENLPLFMEHLESVTELSETRSHWVAKATENLGKIEWDAEITREEAGSELGWKSVSGSTVESAGEVKFLNAPGNRGTEVHASISYIPPAGDAGRLVAKMLSGIFEQMVREDIRRFKRMMETGELPSVKNDPSSRAVTEIPVNI